MPQTHTLIITMTATSYTAALRASAIVTANIARNWPDLFNSPDCQIMPDSANFTYTWHLGNLTPERAQRLATQWQIARANGATDAALVWATLR